MKRIFNVRIILMLCVVASLSVGLISAQFNLMTKRQQLSILEEQQKRIELEVRDLERIIEIEDEAEYVERVARGQLGYANPNEKVFKDIQGEE